MAERETEELRAEQRAREATQRELARDSDDPNERSAHRRRAERAEYLREKLSERARSEEQPG